MDRTPLDLLDLSATVTGGWVYWPCTHGWRRWRDRLIGRRHPAFHGVALKPSADPADAPLTISWDARGVVRIDGLDG